MVRYSQTRIRSSALVSFLLLAFLAGCQTTQQPSLQSDLAPAELPTSSLSLPGETPDDLEQLPTSDSSPDEFESLDLGQSPIPDPTLSRDSLPKSLRSMSLDEVVSIALSDTEILRDLNATVLSAPDSVRGQLDAEISATDPLRGIDAALSAFDARVQANVDHQNNDRVFNNAVIAGGTNVFVQDLATAGIGIQKQARNGALFAIRGNAVHDSNNRPTNLFPSVWTTQLEAEIRQPLLQGRGELFNEIAGPNQQSVFTQPNGILLAQLGQEVSGFEFEASLNNYVNEVIGAYWDLYFAYKNFSTAKAALQDAEDIWKITKSRFESDLPGGAAHQEAQAREQYYLFKARVIESLSGAGGVPGVMQAEANLRRLLNLPLEDGEYIFPADEPMVAEIVFEWPLLVELALDHRMELRRQEARIRATELELLAARNFLLPRLDATVLYRNNGFGDRLGAGSGEFGGALEVAGEGRFQEWQFGLQLAAPVRFRQAHSAVRNAELRLHREQRILRDQQQQIIHGVGNAVRRLDETYALVQVASARQQAARETVEARLAAYEAGAASFDELLDAQQRLADAEVSFFRRNTNWTLALTELSRQKGQLLDNYSVFVEQ